MSTVTEVKKEAAEIIDMLKKLPQEKQEYVNGYIQGVSDTLEKQEQKEAS